MAEREDLIVNGYFFGSYEDAGRARKELSNSEYLEEKTARMSGSQLLAIYDKMLDDKMFMTPVGWDYLKLLRERIRSLGIADTEIRPIPLFINLGVGNDKNEYPHLSKMKIRPAKSPIQRMKDFIKVSIFFNIVLVALVIIMFFITLNSSSPNIINYKTAITNQYSQWEESLKAREEAVREKEAIYENIGG